MTSSLAWKVLHHSALDGLELKEESIPKKLGDHDCLVRIEALSLNFRDLMVANGTYPFPMRLGVVPGSDGAGTVLQTGARVTRFRVGDRVCTTLNQGHIFGSLTPAIMQTSLGGSLDGTMRQHGIFEEDGLVHMPHTLSFREACTLPCAGVTAWNALYGLPGRQLKAGDTVLTLGTGGVSVFALQLAVAAGATVISTTSDEAKAEKLKSLGAQHVVNYRKEKEWGKEVRRFSKDGRGVDFVVEVGGAATLEQSLEAIKLDGVISLVGAVGASDGITQEPGLLNAWYKTCIVRGIAVGSRAQLEELISAIDASGLKPILDAAQFALRDLKTALRFLEDRKHFGKVVVDCW